MINKKGAIELSMTTIIVIVIGVTLLILGLTFVRTIFSRISGISDTTFKKAETLLGEFEQVNEFLTVSPEIIEIETNKDEVVKIIVLNLEEGDIKVAATVRPEDEGISCFFGDTSKTTSKEYTISSGKTKDITLFVKDKKGTIRTTNCNIDVTSSGRVGEDNSKTLAIRVVKEQKLFN